MSSHDCASVGSPVAMVPDAEKPDADSALQLLWPVSPGEEVTVVSRVELQMPLVFFFIQKE